MSVRAVIFDVDGTIVDNHEAHEAAWLVWGARHEVNIDHAFYQEHLYARPNERILRTLLGEQLTDAEVERWAVEKETIYRDMYRPKMTEMPGLSALLTGLASANLACAVASNAERVNVDFVVLRLGDLRRAFRRELRRSIPCWLCLNSLHLEQPGLHGLELTVERFGHVEIVDRQQVPRFQLFKRGTARSAIQPNAPLLGTAA